MSLSAPGTATSLTAAGPASGERLSFSPYRLRKHADYQRVYQAGRKQFSASMSYFVRLRGPGELAEVGPGPRIGLTVGRVMGKAVDRNRMKRRMREALRLHLPALSADVDLVLHPKRSVVSMEFPALERDVLKVMSAVMQAARNGVQPEKG